MPARFNVVCLLILLFGFNGFILAEWATHEPYGFTDETQLAQFFPDSGSPFKRMRYKEKARRQSEPEPAIHYKKLVVELQNLTSIGDLEAFRLIPNIEVLIYWHWGEKIAAYMESHHKQAAEESSLLEQLAASMNMEAPELVLIVRFYRIYQDVSLISPALSWAHYIELIDISDEEQRWIYQQQAKEKQWTSEELKHNIHILP